LIFLRGFAVESVLEDKLVPGCSCTCFNCCYFLLTYYPWLRTNTSLFYPLPRYYGFASSILYPHYSDRHNHHRSLNKSLSSSNHQCTPFPNRQATASSEPSYNRQAQSIDKRKASTSRRDLQHHRRLVTSRQQQATASSTPSYHIKPSDSLLRAVVPLASIIESTVEATHTTRIYALILASTATRY
jgi:hypothetical protein